MPRLRELLHAHPASVGETYGEHLAQASGFGIRMIAAGLACLIHGVLPFYFQTTGSRQIEVLHDRMVVNRARRRSLDVARGEQR
jgi:hypothetical protein